MGYEEEADPPNLLQISIPSYFRCPISSELMSDPVTLCTGSTYDRASIQRWLSDGNRFCPLTRMHLHTREMIPNHTLRRLIQAWRAGSEGEVVDRRPTQQQQQDQQLDNQRQQQHLCQQHHHHHRQQHQQQQLEKQQQQQLEKQQEQLEKQQQQQLEKYQHQQQLEKHQHQQQQQPLEKPQLEELLREMANPCQRAQALAELGNHAKASEENRRRMADAGAVGVLASMLTSPAREDAIATLAQLSLNPSHRNTLVHSNLPPALSSLLHTASLTARRNTATFLKNLATSIDETTLQASNHAIIQGLVILLEEDLHRAAVNITLGSLLAICSPLRNRVKAVEAGAVRLLVELLPEAESAIAELALALLELLCRCAEGREAVSEHALTIPVLARKIFGVSAMGTDSAVVILWAICKYSPDQNIQKKVIDSGVLSKLFFFVQTDYNSRIKLKAADLLKILHNSCRHQISA